VVVVVYTAITLLRAAATEPEDASSLEPLAKALPRG